MIKKLLIFLVIALLAVVFFAGDKLLEISLENICTEITGVRVEMEKIRISIPEASIDIDGMTVYNPEGFPMEIMAEIPDIYVSVDLKRSLRGVLHIREMRFYLKKLNVIKNSQGLINLDALKPVTVAGKTEGGKPGLKIELLKLRAGQVHFRDYSKRDTPSVHTFNVGINETYRDIDDPYTLVQLIISRVLRNTMVSHMINLPMEKVNEVIRGTYSAVGKTAETTAGSIKGVRDTLVRTAGAIGGLLPGLTSHEKAEGDK